MSSGVVNVYDPGQAIKCEATWTVKDTGALYDPDVVRFKYRNPSGDLTTYVYGTDSEVSKLSQGKYRVWVPTTDNPGRWYYRWEAETSAGSPQMALEHSFRVQPSKVL